MRSTGPLVSIALATYQGERFLRQQIDSLLRQNCPNVEIIAVDDGSTDGTLALLEAWERAGVLRVERNSERLGHARNFEKAVSLCRGDYVALCDQDDVWQPDKLSTLVRCVREREAWLGCSDAVLIDEAGTVFRPSVWRTYGVQPRSEGASFAHYLRNCINGCTMLATRALLERALPLPPGFPYFDWWLAYVAAKSEKIAIHPAPLMSYRRHPDTVTGHALRGRNRLQRFREALARVDRMAEAAVVRCRAFVDFETRHGLDTAISSRLLEWAIDFRDGRGERAHREWLLAHPQLFATTTGDWKRQVRGLTRPAPVRKALAALRALRTPPGG